MIKRSRTSTLGRVAGSLAEVVHRRKLFANLRPEVLQLTGPRVEQVMSSMRTESRRYYSTNRARISDPQGLFTLSTACSVLAAYRELQSAGVDEDAAFEAIRRAYVGMYGTQMHHGAAAFLKLVNDPVSFLRRRSAVPFFEAVFGRWFSFEDERVGEGYTLVVTRCGFFDLFTAEGEPQLTRLMCSMDRNWLAAFDTSDRPVATRRSLTLSTGGHRCEFHFDRADAGPAPTIDVTL